MLESNGQALKMADARIAVAVPTFPNPGQPYVYNHVRELVRVGLAGPIFTRNYPKDHGENFSAGDNDIQSRILEIRSELAPTLRALAALPFAGAARLRNVRKFLAQKHSAEFGSKYVCKALAYLGTLEPRAFDLIHSHSLFCSYDLLFLRTTFSVPIVTTYHGMVPRGVKKLEDVKLKKVFHRGDIFLANSEFSKRELVDLGCSAEKIRLVPQGINLEQFKFSPRTIASGKRIVFLTVARLSVEKGHAVAIEGVAGLIREFPNIEYRIVGSGPEYNNLAELIRKRDVAKNIALLGPQYGSDLQRQYAEAHVFILPSIDTRDGYLVETQGVAVQEAQASGIPVVCSSVGGLRDVIVDGETGMLFREGNSADLATKVRQIVTQPNLYEKLLCAGRSDVLSRFDSRVVSIQLFRIYGEVLADSGSRLGLGVAIHRKRWQI